MSAATGSWLKSLLPFVVMCFGGFMALLDIQIVASSLQEIGGGLSAAQDEISWVQTAYLIAEIVVIPLSGWLTRLLSTRWLFAASAAGFTLTSLLCGLAWNIESMIVFRALQGLLGASMIPTMFTSSFYFFQGPRRVYSAAVIGTIASVAPTLGPVIGGWITDTLELALAVLCQSRPGCRDHAADGIPGQDRRARPGAAERRRLSRHRADGGRARHARICAGRRLALELVRRCDDPALRVGRGDRRRAVRRPQPDFRATRSSICGRSRTAISRSAVFSPSSPVSASSRRSI